jgi:nucleoside-diphosphate-sugar epimerase
MKILVTGSKGLIGSALVDVLRTRNDVECVYAVNRSSGASLEASIKHTGVQPIYCRVENEPWVRCLFKDVHPTHIFHFAAEQNDKETCFDNNVASTRLLAKYAPDGCKFILAGSSTVYGDAALTTNTFPANIAGVRKSFECDGLTPTSVYGASKMASEAAVLCEQSRLNVLILRFCAITCGTAKKGLIPAILKKLNDDKQEMLSLFGDAPGSIKPYLCVQDAVAAATHFGLGNAAGVYNITAHNEISVDRVADTVMDAIGIKKEKVWLGAASTPPGDNPVVRMSGTLARQAGWQPLYESCESMMTNILRKEK